MVFKNMPVLDPGAVSLEAMSAFAGQMAGIVPVPAAPAAADKVPMSVEFLDAVSSLVSAAGCVGDCKSLIDFVVEARFLSISAGDVVSIARSEGVQLTL